MQVMLGMICVINRTFSRKNIRTQLKREQAWNLHYNKSWHGLMSHFRFHIFQKSCLRMGRLLKQLLAADIPVQVIEPENETA
jgi:hypothetical protein